MEDLMLCSFYKLSSPDKQAIKKRELQVANIIKKMGNKYVLSKSIKKAAND